MTGQRYVPATGSGARHLGAHWIKDGARPDPSNTLDALMEIDHVIRVAPDGLVHPGTSAAWAPEFLMGTDDDGQILREHTMAFLMEMTSRGWEVETGWSGQYGTRGDDPVMHDSEFIGGDLAEHILSTPGHWVACEIRTDDPECPNGSDSCILSDLCVICTDGTGEDRETVREGWVVMRKDIPSGLGDEPTGSETGQIWPVLWFGKEVDARIEQTYRGYTFQASRALDPEGDGFRGEPRVGLADARKDADEWLTQNVG